MDPDASQLRHLLLPARRPLRRRRPGCWVVSVRVTACSRGWVAEVEVGRRRRRRSRPLGFVIQRPAACQAVGNRCAERGNQVPGPGCQAGTSPWTPPARRPPPNGTSPKLVRLVREAGRA